MNNKDIITTLNWRYATKLYDTSKKVSQEDLETILEAGRLSPSMSNIQPRHFVVISDQDIKDKLFEHSRWNKQVQQAPFLIVLCNIRHYDNDYIDQHIQNTATIRWVDKESLWWYKNMLTWFIDHTDIFLKTNVYIPLGMMISAAANLHIDSSPMWWFDRKAFDEILWLWFKGLESVVLLAIWYRDESDPASKAPKVRRPMDRVVSYIR